MIRLCTSAVTLIQRAPSVLKDTPLEETLGTAAKGRFSPARTSWPKSIGLSREDVLLCKRLSLNQHRPKPQEKQWQQCSLSDGVTDRAARNK